MIKRKYICRVEVNIIKKNVKKDECKWDKRVKNRSVCNKGYKLNNGESKPVNKQWKGGKIKGKICSCRKDLKLIKEKVKKKKEIVKEIK